MKIKKLLTALVSAALLLTSLTSTTYAEPETVAVPEIYCSGIDINYKAGVSLYGLNSNVKFNSSYYDQLDANSQKVYKALETSYKNNSHTNVVEIPFSKSFSESEVKNGKISQWIKEIVTPAYLALLYDHPELSWLVNIPYYMGCGDRIPLDPLTNKYTLEKITFYLDSAPKDSGTSADMKKAVNSALTTINKERGSDKSVYNTLKEINDYLSDRIVYNTKAANDGYTYSQLRLYQTAYSAFYKCNGDKNISTVCAGYAKGFKVLCDAYKIPCVLVDGDAVTNSKRVPHIWNYVYAGGKWWAVDVTWNDQESGTVYDFFLVGGNHVPESGFEKIAFTKSHIISNNWSDSLNTEFVCPALANGKCNPRDASELIGNGSFDNVGVTASPTAPTTTAPITKVTAKTTTRTTVTTSVIIDPVTNEKIIRGDISGNGIIDLSDAIAIAQFILGTRTFTDEEMNIADFDNNGVVGLNDAIGIAKFMLQNMR